MSDKSLTISSVESMGKPKGILRVGILHERPPQARPYSAPGTSKDAAVRCASAERYFSRRMLSTTISRGVAGL
jgi:hypothetical protein